ncbi:MAG: threonine synthase [Leptospirales bacterium]
MSNPSASPLTSPDGSPSSPYLKGLKCRECGRLYNLAAIHVCEFCFGPLEVDYDYEAIRRVLTREEIRKGPNSLWRYKHLLPVVSEPTIGLHAGMTPLLKADRLGKLLGLNRLYIKNDTVNHPTLSFKDRVVSVAINRAREMGFKTVACASTGNLANSVSAHAASAGMDCFVFIPHDLESGKILGNLIYKPTVVAVKGNYDDVNRLCSEISAEYPWAFVNINIRPYYAEGSKSMAFETAEQLGWRIPDQVVVPIASGSLLTKIWKGFQEFSGLGIVDRHPGLKVNGAQASGCSPVYQAFQAGRTQFIPVKPKTIAKSLAIGNPADGYYSLDVVGKSKGQVEAATDPEIVEGMVLLAETEGVFAETAGGVTVACLKKLAEKGAIRPDDLTVAYITGNGLKTMEALSGYLPEPVGIEPNLASFRKIVNPS